MEAHERRRRPGVLSATMALAAALVGVTACGRKPAAAPPRRHETLPPATATPAPRPTTAPVAPAAPVAGREAAIATAEADLERDGTAAKGAAFRGITTWQQATGGRIAVCGQTNPFPSDGTIFVPFVSVIQAGRPAAVARFIGKTTDDADRVYEAIVADCFEGGGPTTTRLPSLAPIPPLPNDVRPRATPAGTDAAPQVSPSGPSPAPPAPPAQGNAAPASAPAPASGAVTMRQDGNLHTAPHGPTIRIVPAGTTLHVFGTAPGGWLLVGDGAPQGWVHDSMVVR